MCIVHTVECHHSRMPSAFLSSAPCSHHCTLPDSMSWPKQSDKTNISLYISQFCHPGVPKCFRQHLASLSFNLSFSGRCRLAKTDIVSLDVLEKIRFAPSAHVWELSVRQGWRQRQRRICRTTNAAYLYHHLQPRLYKTGSNLDTKNLEFWYGE